MNPLPATRFRVFPTPPHSSQCRSLPEGWRSPTVHKPENHGSIWVIDISIGHQRPAHCVDRRYFDEPAARASPVQRRGGAGGDPVDLVLHSGYGMAGIGYPFHPHDERGDRGLVLALLKPFLRSQGVNRLRTILLTGGEFPASGRPGRRLRARLDALGIPVIYTSDSGAALLTFERAGWSVRTMTGHQTRPGR